MLYLCRKHPTHILSGDYVSVTKILGTQTAAKSSKKRIADLRTFSERLYSRGPS